jgi:prepilin-type N-terminal cleavage/methylation domain-containing protein/prepilin-type processing-associated H-X9-DG protein
MTVSALRRTAAFSLIELLVVIAIIAIMSAMMYNFALGGHKPSQAELCADNLQKIYLSANIYATDHGVFPRDTNAQTSEDVLTKLVPRYTTDTSIFTCPSTHDPEIPSGTPLSGYKISYAYYMGRDTNNGVADALMSDRQINTLSKNIGDQVFSITGKAPGNNHNKDGGNVLFCDGSVRQTPPQAAFSLAFSNGIVLLNPKP